MDVDEEERVSRLDLPWTFSHKGLLANAADEGTARQQLAAEKPLKLTREDVRVAVAANTPAPMGADASAMPTYQTWLAESNSGGRRSTGGLEKLRNRETGNMNMKECNIEFLNFLQLWHEWACGATLHRHTALSSPVRHPPGVPPPPTLCFTVLLTDKGGC